MLDDTIKVVHDSGCWIILVATFRFTMRIGRKKQNHSCFFFSFIFSFSLARKEECLKSRPRTIRLLGICHN